jgi:hypothetical protein
LQRDQYLIFQRSAEKFSKTRFDRKIVNSAIFL